MFGWGYRLVVLAAAFFGVAAAAVCPEKFVLLSARAVSRNITSVVDPLRFLLPEKGHAPTREEAMQFAEWLLDTDPVSDSALKAAGGIPSGHGAAWRAAEILDAVGGALSPEHLILVEAYRTTRDQLLHSVVPVSVAALYSRQRQRLVTSLEFMGLHAAQNKGKVFPTPAPWMGDNGLALARANYLLSGMKDKMAPQEFDAALREFLDGADDLIASRALPRQIASAPFIFSRWAPIKIPDRYAIHGVNTVSFQDPLGRMHVNYVPPRELSDGSVNLRMVNAIALVPTKKAGEESLAMRTFKKTGKEESTDSTGCVKCHRVGAEQLLSMTKAREGVTPPPIDGKDILPGESPTSFFVSSRYFRNGEMASSLAKPR